MARLYICTYLYIKDAFFEKVTVKFLYLQFSLRLASEASNITGKSNVYRTFCYKHFYSLLFRVPLGSEGCCPEYRCRLQTF